MAGEVKITITILKLKKGFWGSITDWLLGRQTLIYSILFVDVDTGRVLSSHLAWGPPNVQIEFSGQMGKMSYESLEWPSGQKPKDA